MTMKDRPQEDRTSEERGFLLSRGHIELLVKALKLSTIEEQYCAGQTLWDANARCLAALYGKNAALEMGCVIRLGEVLAPRYSFWFTTEAMKTDPVHLLKACACFDSQSCDVDGYERSPAAELVQRIRLQAIGQLPGYDAAPWEVM